MKINFNMSAIRTNNALTSSDNALSASLERLSTGFKINRARDNASGLAISKRMSAQIEGLNLASSNANNGISVLETAEGALSEIHAMLQRMNELAVQASNGSNMSTDRSAIQSEIQQLNKEIIRITSDTEFNGQTLLNGNFDLRGYTSDNSVRVETYSDEVTAKKYTINTTAGTPPTITLGAEFPSGSQVTYHENEATISAPGDFEIKLSLNNLRQTGTGNMTLDITGMGAMRIQIGANEGQELGIRIPTISLKTLGIEDIDLSTEAAAKKSIEKISNAISFTSQARSRLGAYQNRLEHSASSLDITEENMTAAYSRIMDVNMATEMTEYTKYQIMTQASTSMLVQANERPQKVLQLLQ